MKVYVDELPKGCDLCYLLGVSQTCNWCPLLLDDNNDCVEVENLDQRLPDCPLILIKPWRLESCETCARGNCFIAHHLDQEMLRVPKMTCKRWRAK